MIIDLWQIGKPGGTLGKEFPTTGGWRKEFDYIVGTDADPINRPNAPLAITVPGNKPNEPSTDKFNIHFTLGRDYAEGELTLFYDRYGSETDTLTLDGRLWKEIQGKGERKLLRNALSLPAISSGQHTLSITTRGGTGGNHWIDYLKLTYEEKEVKPEPKPEPKHLVLKATDVWFDTGVDVTAGKALIITATGRWKVDQEPATPEVTADGFVGFQLSGAVLPTADFGSLIGRIGEYGAPFFVGSTFNAPSPSSGRLYLQINDVMGTLGDNSGELSVLVEN